MRSKKVNAAFSVALCGCLLAGCNIPGTSVSTAPSSMPISESSAETSPAPSPVQVEGSTSSNTPSTPLPVYEEDAGLSSSLSADEFISCTEDVNQFETYLQILTSYVYEPCTNSELADHQMIDPVIFMCARNSEAVPDANGVIVLDEEDLKIWAENLFGRSIDFDLLNAECENDFYIDYNSDDHTISARSFTDKVAVRGYGVNLDDLNFQADGQTLYVIAPVLKIEDRGIWEPYQTLRYEFILNSDENGKPYYLLQNVVLCP